MSIRPLVSALAALALSACATGQIGPDTCQIQIAEPPDIQDVRGGVDVEITVQGRAGTAATTWLAARKGPGDYLSGKGVEVGPGPFKAIVELGLTAPAAGYTVVLELASGKRCSDDT